jgi:colanic acid/amylovoran biosynthesis glycosyltransferase
MAEHDVRNIGYLVPEFPGQTHNFFWREIAALRELGMEVTLVSTRRPPAAIESPTWAAQARALTTYLFPPQTLSLASDLLWAALRPAALARMLCAIARAQVEGAAARARLFGLALTGVHLARELRRQSIDHIHVHSCANSAHVAMFAHLATGLTYSLTLHNRLLDHGPDQAGKWRHARFGIVISDWVETDLRERLGPLLPPLLQAPMGVDTDKFRRSGAYAGPAAGAPLRLFSCARLNPMKGHLDVLAALALLVERGHDAHLEIAGEDDHGGAGYRRVIEARIGELGLQGRVRLLGAVSEGVVVERLQQAHVFVLASMAEPLGVALMEAMSMELPVVATRAGGVPEMIRDDVEGVLVPPSQPQMLADAIHGLASDPPRALRLASAARERVEQRFSHRRSAQAIATGVRTPVLRDAALRTAQG